MPPTPALTRRRACLASARMRPGRLQRKARFRTARSGPGLIPAGTGTALPPTGSDGSRETRAFEAVNCAGGARSDAAHPGVGEAPGMPGIGADAAGPPAEKSPLPNGEVGSGSDPSGYGNSPPPIGSDGSRENRASEAVGCAGGARSDDAHPGADEAPGTPRIGADATGPPAEKSPLPNGETGSGFDASGYGNSPPPSGTDGLCENKPA